MIFILIVIVALCFLTILVVQVCIFEDANLDSVTKTKLCMIPFYFIIHYFPLNKILKLLKPKYMINMKILMKAMSFMFLPTLSILAVIFFWFFSWTNFVDFMTSGSFGSSFMRLLMIIAEAVLVIIMYNYYIRQENAKTFNKQVYEGIYGSKLIHKNYEDGYGYVRSDELGLPKTKNGMEVNTFYKGEINNKKVYILTFEHKEE